MNFDRLETFLAAADEGNFTYAGRRLFLSQSAVSQQIRELELELGVSLFERRGRGLLLTPAGERLRDLVRPLLGEARRIRADMDGFRGATQGVLRVGASRLPGIYLLPHALGRYSQTYPNVATTLAVDNVAGIMGRLQAGQIDLAIVEDMPDAVSRFGCERHAFLEDEIGIVVSPGHRWARRGKVRLEQLQEEAYIFRLPDSPVRTMVAERLAEAGFDPSRLRVRFELEDAEGIKHAVMAGLGVGFVSRHATRIEREAGLLAEVELEGISLTRTLWVVRPPSARLGEHHHRFSELLEERSWLPGQAVAR